jgi:anti-sigma factor RsiW
VTACPRLDDAGPYVLGALPEAEWADYARHLAGCEACRAKVADLQLVADALPGAVAPVEAPAALQGRLMAVVRAEAELLRAAGPEADRPPAPAPAPSRRFAWLPALRPVPAAALATVLLAVGIGVGTALRGGADPASERAIAARVDPRLAPAGHAELRVRAGQARLVVEGLPAPPEGRIYQVWLERTDDRRPPRPTDALFSVTRRGDASVAVPGDLEDVDAVLVTDEPLGGSSVPTRPAPIISVAPA